MEKLLSAEDILTADDLTKEKVSVPEWGGYVYVRTMTGEERDAWEASMIRVTHKRQGSRVVEQNEADLRNIRAKLIARVCCTEDGTSIFNPIQIDRLGKKSAAALDRLWEVAQRLNHLRNEDVEELAKNSAGVPSAVSG